MNISIRLEEEKDFKSVEYMTREAFWDLYKPGCDEHLLVHKIKHAKLMLQITAINGKITCNTISAEKCDIMADSKPFFQ